MGYSGETNDINFSSGTTAFYGFLGFLINGESTNAAGLLESNVQMPLQVLNPLNALGPAPSISLILRSAGIDLFQSVSNKYCCSSTTSFTLL